MKVLYEPFLRRARPTSTNNNGSSLEICHPGEFHLPKTPNGTHDSHHLGNGNGMKSSTNGTTQRNVRHIIDYDAICIAKELGVGEFGVVQQGIWTNPEGQSIQVAVKCLSAARLENSRQEFLKEATIMHSIVHEHVVTLHGIVLEPSIMLVTELAPLRSLLECLKEPTLISHFPVMSLCVFAAQIADGMAYLESKRLIHRDLAARNILVFSKNKVKISDFGLSRALGVGKDYYQSNFNVNLKLPIAWCAPECINYLKFTSQSDVWAYGVTLWEMFSFGFQPWAALTGQQILETIDQPNYQRLEQPECCPRDYYQLMLKCWAHEPAQRPNFSEILQILPDCKPEMLQAIRSSSSNHHRNDELLAHKSGDIVTVIEKNGILDSPGQMESSVSSPYWKGVNNDRKVGYFNPSDFVTFLGMNLPSTNVPTSASNSFERNASSNGHSGPNSSHSNHHHSHSIASTISSTLSHSSKFFRGILDASKHHISGGSGSPNGSRKNGHHSSNPNHRLRTDMISKPQGDLKHTGHVGADGVFGDVPFGENSGNDKQKGASTSVKHPPQLSHPVYSHGNLYTTSSKDDDELEKADHEYQEISDEEHNNNSNSNNNNHPQHHNDHHFLPLESPSFEVLDFGPSLMDEVLGALDHHQIRPDLCHETSESEYAHNEHGINLKNEVRELNLKHCKDQNGINASHSRKKHNSVKPITEEEENELDSAIAMAKDIASRSLMQEEYDLIPADSPKTPNSPNKRKSHFTFKFPTTHKHHNHSPKGERRTFSEETNAIGDIIESITPAAKEAYLSLIDRGVSKPEAAAPITANGHKSMTLTRPDVKPPPPPPSSQGSGHLQNALYMTPDPVDSIVDNNPLRMLRTAGIVRPKVRGNRSFSQPRIPTTAGLARVASARSQLGSPPPVPNELEEHYSQPSTIQSTMNALPLPPRDRSRPLIQLKMHQRRHPLVLPSLDINGANGLGHHQIYSNGYDAHNLYDSVRVPKQVTCPQPPAAYLNSYAAQQRNSDPFSSGQANALSHDDSGESLEDEMAKAFENIKMSTSIDMGAAPTTPKEPETNGQSHNGTSNGHSNGQSNGYSMMMAPAKNLDCDEVRVMQKVLGSDNTLTDDECYELLTSTDMDVHKAIKCVKLQQQIRSQNIAIPGCDWAKMMSKFNWNVRQASNYLIATHGVPEDTTEV